MKIDFKNQNLVHKKFDISIKVYLLSYILNS